MNTVRTALHTLGVLEDGDDLSVRRTRRDWVIDSAAFVLVIALGAVALASSTMHGLEGPLVVVDAIGGALLSVSLWWRRRFPVALALASIPILVFAGSAGPAALILLFTVARYRPWPLAVAITALHIPLLPVDRALRPQGDSVLSHYLSGVLITGAIVALGVVMRGRGQAARDRSRRDEAEQQLHVEQARYAERTRIAREMHDVLAHRISLLSLHAGALEFRPDAPSEEIAHAAGVIRASAHQALEDLRAVIGVLRDGDEGAPPAPPQPTLAALPGLLEESRAAGMRLYAEVRVEDLAAVPDAIGRHALRIVQEALTNARKHAPTAAVDLTVKGAPGDGLTIEVRNPVRVLTPGVPQIPGSGTGLIGLVERATLSGGHLEHGLDDHGDFRLRAWLPWPA
jgi:signal transduction histidine kinase